MGRIAEALKKAQHERQVHVPVNPLLGGTISDDSLRFTHTARDRVGYQQAQFWSADPRVIGLSQTESQIAEQYRAARTWLLSRVKPGERQCVAFTSSRAGEGTSISTANLAVTMSEVRHMRVLAVDANLRNPNLAGLYGLTPAPGLGEVLSGGARLQDAMIRTPRENLHFLPAGEIGSANPAELLNSTQAAKIFAQLRDSFDYVLVDTPAIQDWSDIGAIGALCCGVVVIVRMHQTPAPVVQQSIQWLQANRLNVIGCLGACSGRG